MNGLITEWTKNTVSTAGGPYLSFVIPFSSIPLCTVSSNDNNGLSYIEGLELIELSTTQYRVNRQNNACNDWFMFAQGY